jgi:hypothetical protein
MTALAHELSVRGAIDVREAFIDASFAPAKKGGRKVGKTTKVEDREAVCLAAELPRLVVRYERHAENFLGMLQLASSLLLLGIYEMGSSLASLAPEVTPGHLEQREFVGGETEGLRLPQPRKRSLETSAEYERDRARLDERRNRMNSLERGASEVPALAR